MSDAEIGEINVQFVADSKEAKRELEELRRKIGELEHLRAGYEDHALEGFDSKILLSDSDD